jgi:hypothetical protein
MKFEKMIGGARFGKMASFVIAAITVGFILFTKTVQTLLLFAGLFLVFYGITQDLTGCLVTASVFTLLYILISRKGLKEGFEDAEEVEEEPKPKTKGKRVPPPDNGERAEMFELGKKYKMPGEADDSEFHLDAGTTFMNAYKALKPDQVAAMTKDTQELMETQKQLMSTLQTLKPLITDGKQMMEMFQSYFGSGNPTPN